MRTVWRRVLQLVAVLLVLAFAGLFVHDRWDAIVSGLRTISILDLVLALALVLAGLFASMMSWRSVLIGLGSALPVPTAARIYFLSQLGKYIPGSVWPIAAQTQLSREYGVPAARAAFAAFTQVVVSVVVGAVVGAVLLVGASPETLRSYWWVLIVAALGIAGLLPPVFNRLLKASLHLIRRSAQYSRVPGAAIGTSAVWCLAMWAAFGGHLAALLRGAAEPGPNLLVVATGAYALAWVVGFVIIILPAGAGAREAALVLGLAPILGPGAALGVAVVSRFVMLIGDFVTAAVAVLASRMTRRGDELTVGPHDSEA